jgi:hypothetical protein
MICYNRAAPKIFTSFLYCLNLCRSSWENRRISTIIRLWISSRTSHSVQNSCGKYARLANSGVSPTHSSPVPADSIPIFPPKRPR